MAHGKEDDESVPEVRVTEQMQLRTLAIGIAEVSWSRVRITSDRWLCVVHRRPDDKKLLQATVIDCEGDIVRSLQLNGLTSAQVSPDRDVVALSTRDKIHCICLKTNRRLSWIRFPCPVEHWSWVGKSKIGIVGKERVYLWHLINETSSYEMNRSSRLNDTQIVKHEVSSDERWHILQGLKLDENNGSITGIVQIYCPAYNHSTVLEAESASLTTYRFSPNSYDSQILVLVTRTSSSKISIIELGPQETDRNLLVNRSEPFQWKDPDDIVTCIVCVPESSLIYLLSKKGFLSVFSLETCTPLIVSQRICSDIIFTGVRDTRTKGAIAVARNGQILSIEVWIRSKNTKNQSDQETSYRNHVKEDHCDDQITRL